jgi:hypothetical protein
MDKNSGRIGHNAVGNERTDLSCHPERERRISVPSA